MHQRGAAVRTTPPVPRPISADLGNPRVGQLRVFRTFYVLFIIFDNGDETETLVSPSTAAGSGGAYLHSGVAVALERCSFVGNKAGGEGPAVLSLGIAENISDAVFDSNAFYCGSGTYGYEMNVSDAEVRCRSTSCEVFHGEDIVLPGLDEYPRERSPNSQLSAGRCF